jgi:hypothetical protein
MPYEHRAEPSVLLAVDQQLGEGAALRVAPELADPVGALFNAGIPICFVFWHLARDFRSAHHRFRI